MLWKVANPAAGPAQAKLSFKLDLEASDQVNKLSCLLGCLAALMHIAFMQLAPIRIVKATSTLDASAAEQDYIQRSSLTAALVIVVYTAHHQRH